MLDHIWVVTRKTRLEEMLIRFNTKAQAKFCIEQYGGDFSHYETEHAIYESAVDRVIESCGKNLKVQKVERALVPTLMVSPQDLFIVVGQDGLVANTAKYAGEQPILAVNPDPQRYEGILLPFNTQEVASAIRAALTNRLKMAEVTLGEAVLQDGQRLLAFNDLFIGAKTHVSARYVLEHENESEEQSSSGIIVSTGAGSTGWLSSIFNFADGICRFQHQSMPEPVRMGWEDPRLIFSVREPFLSRTSGTELTMGYIHPDNALKIESRMAANGVIFSDGIEEDYLEFSSGSLVTVQAAKQRARLLLKERVG